MGNIPTFCRRLYDGARRRLPEAAKTARSLVLVFGLGGIVLTGACSRRPLPQAANRAPGSDADFGSRTAAISRPVYPYSVVRGGVDNARDFAVIRAADPIARAHYRGIGEDVSRRILAEDQRMYASYRIGDAIYWTSHAVLVHKGEGVLTDGTNLIRARCGNRLSKTPRQPTRFIQPPEVAEDVPIPLMEEAPPEIFLRPDAMSIPIGLPVPAVNEVGISHPAPPGPESGPLHLPPGPVLVPVFVPGPAVRRLPVIDAPLVLPPAGAAGRRRRSGGLVIAGAPVIVPEASTWMLMLAGLGAVALRIRLRRQASQPGAGRS